MVEDDDFKSIFDYEHRILVIPSIFIGQFGTGINQMQISSILKDMGFAEVYESEHSVDFLLDEINKYIETHEKPVISSFCPAVIRLIQVRFPSLVDNVLRLKQPLELTTHYLRRKYSDKYKADPASVGIFYVTPCAAKIASIKAPVGNYFSPINGVINMDYLYNRVQHAYNQCDKEDIPLAGKTGLSGKGLKFSLTGGEKENIKHQCLAVDGIENVIAILEHLENGDIEGLDYIELRVCDESCAGGILTPGNRFLAAERLRQIAKELPASNQLEKEYQEYLSSVIDVGRIIPRSMVKYDSDVSRALEMMEKAHKIRESLPDIDCGTCGAPSCEALSEDIVRGQATIDACVFMRARHKKEGLLSSEEAQQLMEQTWGPSLFDN
jgi:hypothetical protein